MNEVNDNVAAYSARLLPVAQSSTPPVVPDLTPHRRAHSLQLVSAATGASTSRRWRSTTLFLVRIRSACEEASVVRPVARPVAQPEVPYYEPLVQLVSALT